MLQERNVRTGFFDDEFSSSSAGGAIVCGIYEGAAGRVEVRCWSRMLRNGWRD
jgi:hypothetical protein